MRIHIDLKDLEIILMGLGFTAGIGGFILDINNRVKCKRSQISYACIGFVMLFIIIPTVIFILACLASNSYDDIKPISISPTRATAEIDKFYPWGITIKLDNGNNYRTRVEDSELLVDLLNNGALLGKRANSLDIYCYINNDTICIPFEKPQNIHFKQYIPKR